MLPHQFEPEFHWSIEFKCVGRGGGKTRCAAEWLWWYCWSRPGTRALILAPTFNDLKFTCLEGQSGIVNVMPRELIKTYNKSTHEIWLHNGSHVRCIPGESYDRLRGPEHNVAWCDEIGAFQYPTQAYDMMMFGLRLGDNPQLLLTSTPRNIPLLHDILERAEKDETIFITTASTYDNPYLPQSFIEQIGQYEGTELGRQEIHAEILAAQNSIFNRTDFKLWPADKLLPRMHYLIWAFDTATSDKDYNDYSAGTLLGVFLPYEDPAEEPIPLDPTRACVFVIDTWRDHLQYPDLRDHIEALSKTAYGDDRNQYRSHKKPNYIVVEDASSGTQLIQELGRMRIPIVGRKPGMLNKVQRANLVSPMTAWRRVYLWEGEVGKPHKKYANWLREITTFPNTPLEQGVVTSDRKEGYDDQVDSFVIGLRFIKDQPSLFTIDIHADPERFADDDVGKKNSYNPYSV